MRIVFDRDVCIGMYQCVDDWSGFEKDMDAGKADLVDGVETDDDVYVVDVPEGEEFDAEMAARVCPVDAITLVDGDEQIVP